MCEQWDSATNCWRVRLRGGEVRNLRPENLALDERDDDSIDGDPLTEEDLTALAALDAAQAAETRSRASGYRVQGSYGVWTQVTGEEPPVGLATPADFDLGSGGLDVSNNVDNIGAFCPAAKRARFFLD